MKFCFSNKKHIFTNVCDCVVEGGVVAAREEEFERRGIC